MNIEEQQVINLFKELLIKYDKQGSRQVRDGHTRTSIFGRQLRFDLSKSFPLLTHRQFFVRGIFQELLWMLRGQTDNKILTDQNVHIWDQWEGQINENNPSELGKIYGHLWRNFGETSGTVGDNGNPYSSSFSEFDYLVEGFDQISWVVNEIKNNPTSSRLIVSSWEPRVCTNTPKEAVLPPCHLLFQFFVEDGKLSCQLYQRSSDISTASGFNIAAYALLTHMIAQQCDLDVGEFVWAIGDCHLYEDQLEDVREMAGRETHPFPQLKLKKAKDLFSYEWSDVEIIGYQHSGKMSNLKVAI